LRIGERLEWKGRVEKTGFVVHPLGEKKRE